MKLQLENKKPSKLLLIPFFLIAIFIVYMGFQNNIYKYNLFSNNISEFENKIIVFYQPNCPYCVKELPILQDLSNQYNIVSINVLENVNISNKYEIKATPTLIFMFNNNTKKIESSLNKKEILEIISKLKNNEEIDIEIENKGCFYDNNLNKSNNNNEYQNLLVKKEELCD
jgi:thiol-disulfide isomerase/thioredoxin